jgi:hypothetical protein
MTLGPRSPLEQKLRNSHTRSSVGNVDLASDNVLTPRGTVNRTATSNLLGSGATYSESASAGIGSARAGFRARQPESVLVTLAAETCRFPSTSVVDGEPPRSDRVKYCIASNPAAGDDRTQRETMPSAH